MEGFWTVQFAGVQGIGGGALTLINGVLYGGDTSFLYRGTYTQQGNNITARVHVSRFAPGLPNVMGRDNFDLELNGTLQQDTITGVGTIPGTQLRLQATLTKQGDLPRAAAA
jgi:T3SS negative regulator,GrlR